MPVSFPWWKVEVGAVALHLALALPPARATEGRMRAPALAVTLDHPSPALMRFLKRAYKDDEGMPAVWAHVATVRLAHRQTDLIVVQATQGDCGSGGCGLSVYESARGGGAPFHGRGSASVNRPPVRLLPTFHHGLPDIVVHTQYGTSHDFIPVVLAFNGRKYPDNPTMPPVRRAVDAEDTGGTLLISDFDPGTTGVFGWLGGMPPPSPDRDRDKGPDHSREKGLRLYP